MKLIFGIVAAALATCQGPSPGESYAVCSQGVVEPQDRVRACDRWVDAQQEGSRGYAAALLWRAHAKESAGDIAGALADYDATLEIWPESGSGLLGRGRLLLETGNFAAAEQTLHRAIEVNDSVIARDMLGAHALLRGDFQEAHDYYDAVLEREGDDPMDVVGLYGRGAARLRMGDEAGRADIERAEELSPTVRQHFEERGIRS